MMVSGERGQMMDAPGLYVTTLMVVTGNKGNFFRPGLRPHTERRQSHRRKRAVQAKYFVHDRKIQRPKKLYKEGYNKSIS
jgi:hypothetical protein